MKRIFAAALTVVLLLSVFAYQESAVFGSGKVYVREKGGTLHLRSEKTTQSESLGIVHHGDEIRVLDYGGEWSYIYSFRVGCDGYIKTKYIVDFIEDENVFTEKIIDSVTDSSPVYPLPGQYTLDMDMDGISDKVKATLHYDEFGMEYLTLAIETAASQLEAYLPYSSYAAGIAFAKLDESGRVYALVTGDEASSDFVTFVFYVDGESLKYLEFASPLPFEHGIYMDGSLEKVEDGFIHLSPIIDVLGTRVYALPMIYDSDSSMLVPAGDGTFASNYDFSDPEIWEYASLRTKADISFMQGDTKSELLKDTDLIVTWVNCERQEIGFVTKDGKTGYFPYQKSEKNYWGIEIFGIHEEDAFYEIPYAG